MAKLDVYLRSIERFGAAGAVLTSGQAVTLRFPTGDRHATQVTPHEQLVALVREIAPPNLLDQIDKQRPARFEIDSNAHRYAISVSPKPGAWQVAIESVVPPAAPPARAQTPAPQPAPSSGAPSSEMLIERGQYDSGPVVAPTTSGSTLLDQLTRAARLARASDVYLMAGTSPVLRLASELAPSGGGVIDGETMSRELGVVAPPDARAEWSETGTAMFTYGDGQGRVRVTLTRDQRGPGAALRLLPDEPPALERLNLRGIDDWLAARGLIVVAGPSGAGKTVTLGSLVRALGERKRRVVTIEEPIELVHASSWVSQRAVGEHVATVSAGVAAAMNENADAIVIGRVSSEATARGVVEAVAGGHLVLTTVVAPVAGVALDRMIAHLAADQRELAHGLLFSALLGTIQPMVGRGGERTFELTSRQN
jgi:twitching motility protein PilT